MRRRDFLAASSLPLAGCRPAQPMLEGGFDGVDQVRGHRMRAPLPASAPTVTRRTGVLIAGAGVAGLAAARALRQRGIDDFAVLELEDQPGGNSRSTNLGAMACPLGAHYLPLPGPAAHEVQDLLEELGLRRRAAGRWEYDEHHLCHSPQERLHFRGAWQDGLLPMHDVGAPTLAQYQRFATLVTLAQHTGNWSLPSTRVRRSPTQQALSTITFQAWLEHNGLTDPRLRWYLDYCCRDDYGAGVATVSAWAGLHYFASRHGFHVPGSGDSEAEPVLTWPEGNAWLVARLARPLQQGAEDRLHGGRIVLRIAQTKHGVELDALDARSGAMERWQARHCVVALPLLAALRAVQSPPDFLRAAALAVRYAPWLVANIELAEPLVDRGGAPPSWDNVIHGDPASAPGLGYVDAMHQSLRSVPGPTVLTYYRSLGDLPDVRRLLLELPWQAWRDAIFAELKVAHPDLPAKARRMLLTRYGHAMAMPVPLTHEQAAAPSWVGPASSGAGFGLAHGRISFAHSDWAGYSVFEEAFTLGHAAAMALRL